MNPNKSFHLSYLSEKWDPSFIDIVVIMNRHDGVACYMIAVAWKFLLASVGKLFCSMSSSKTDEIIKSDKFI